MVKNPPILQETWVRSLGGEKFPGEGHGNPLLYSCLDSRMDKEPGGLQSIESQRAGYN